MLPPFSSVTDLHAHTYTLTRSALSLTRDKKVLALDAKGAIGGTNHDTCTTVVPVVKHVQTKLVIAHLFHSLMPAVTGVQ